jgi:hypothetical protein
MYLRESLTLKLTIVRPPQILFYFSQNGKNDFSGSVAYALIHFLYLAQVAFPVCQKIKISLQGYATP